jgi:hypothetical protein
MPGARSFRVAARAARFTRRRGAASSSVGWSHLIRYSDDATHAFGESDERGPLLAMCGTALRRE